MDLDSLNKIVIFGRPFKPLALAMAMSMGTVFWFNIVTDSDVLVDSLPGNLVGVMAGFSLVLLVWSWWAKSESLLRWGLLVSSGVWVSRMTLIALLEGLDFYGVWLSMAWVVAAVGAYLYEIRDGEDI